MTTHYDTIVVGAGFAGVRTLWEMKKLGKSVKVLEAGTSVGGTWYWNRYPGARTDSEAWVYCFNFDDQLCQEWDWSERFPSQAEMERYFNFAVDKLDLRKDIQFSTRVNSCEYDEGTNTWTIGTTDGEIFTCQYLVSATGLLHLALKPPFPGLENFRGDWYMTANWPKEPVDFSGKKVAVIGTGATGIQLIPVIARDAEELTILQRTPNYVIPGRNHTLEENHLAEIKRTYDKIWAQTDTQVFAFAMDAAGRMSTDVPREQWDAIFDAGWEAGGFRFLFETFDDLLVNTEVNEAAAEFIRGKIRAIVKDPATAELLCPDYYYGGKRPPMGTGFYETFNRPNVKLVSVADNAITAITENGVQLADGTVHEVDVICFALGFDAMTGALAQMNVRGSTGKTLQEFWNPEPVTFMGVTVPGYPNFFMLSGPQSTFANIPMVIDRCVKFVSATIQKADAVGADVVEPTMEASEAYNAHCKMLLDFNTIIKSGIPQNSWFLGANVEGKSQTAVYFYYGGAAGYFAELRGVIDKDFEGLAFANHAERATV